MSAYPFELQREMDEYLSDLTFSADPRTAGLEQAMRYTLMAGGKRVRPVLALATARALGVERRTVLPLGAALELIHSLSLIHDDLPAMDNADLRRGQPANHVVHGEAVAILAGDTMFAEAFRLLLSEVAAPPHRVLAAATVVAEAVATNGMAGGQYIDLTGASGPEDVVYCHRLKTSALIEASVQAVVALAECPAPVAAALRSYGRQMGLMFQAVDDLLDACGAAVGKPAGRDVANGARPSSRPAASRQPRRSPIAVSRESTPASRGCWATGASCLRSRTSCVHRGDDSPRARPRSSSCARSATPRTASVRSESAPTPSTRKRGSSMMQPRPVEPPRGAAW